MKDARKQTSRERKKKEPKEQKRSKDRVKSFRILAAPTAATAAGDDDPAKLDAIKEPIIKGTFIKEKSTPDDLNVEEWMKVICTHARQEDLENLCEVNSLFKQGGKEALCTRTYDHLKGGEEE